MFWGRVEAGKNIYICARRMWFWFIPKTASTASSSTGALVPASSFQPVFWKAFATMTKNERAPKSRRVG
jgi:hypothetical protein